MIQKPTKPFKNLEEFRTANLGMGFDTHAWPCMACQGKGCDACGGTGIGTRKACQEVYNSIMLEYKCALAAYNGVIALAKSALSKLTKEELAAVKLVMQ